MAGAPFYSFKKFLNDVYYLCEVFLFYCQQNRYWLSHQLKIMLMMMKIIGSKIRML